MSRPLKTIEFRGQTMTLSQVGMTIGLSASAVHGRLARNQSLTDPPRYGRGPQARKAPRRRAQGPVVPVERARADYVGSVVAEFGQPGNPTTLEQALLAAWDSGHNFAKYGCRSGEQEPLPK